LFFGQRIWMIGAIQSLEALRGGQAGAIMLGIFLIYDNEVPADVGSYLETLRGLNAVGRALLTALTPFQFWAAQAWLDYVNAVD
jgi:hypothetical protein